MSNLTKYIFIILIFLVSMMINFTSTSLAKGLGKAGGVVQIDLLPTPEFWESSAQGHVLIFPPWSEDHPVWGGETWKGAGVIVFDMQHVTQLNAFSSDGNGDYVYAAYMWTTSFNRNRLISFAAIHMSMSSYFHILDDFPERGATLLTEDICIEIYLETDDGIDAPDTGYSPALMRGETSPGVCDTLKGF